VRRVLFDEDMPRQLRKDLPEFEIRTVQEQGWSAVQNGELLRRAAEQFDVFVTADQRLQHQQNIGRFNIGVVIIVAVDTRLPRLRTALLELRTAISDVAPGSFSIVKVGSVPRNT
jgi:hypothetical protein